MYQLLVENNGRYPYFSIRRAWQIYLDKSGPHYLFSGNV